jgi:hypothetical protein
MSAPRFRALCFGPMGSKARIQAMQEGIAALGGEVVSVPDNRLEAIRRAMALGGVTFAFTCGMHDREAVARGFLRGLGVPLLVLDCGYFSRASHAKDAEGYNQLGLGRLGWVPQEDCSGERFAAHGLAVAERVQTGGKVALVLGQVPGDSQHGLGEAGLVHWLEEEAVRFLALGYTLRFRPHPKAPGVQFRSLRAERSPEGRTLGNDLVGVGVAITYNSTAGLEALMAGVPVRCHSGAHYAHVAALCDPAALREHLHRLAWAQWTCAELRTGEPLRWMHRYTCLLPSDAA